MEVEDASLLGHHARAEVDQIRGTFAEDMHAEDATAALQAHEIPETM
jgi:hypothetical protein